MIQDKATVEGDENPSVVAATVEPGETTQPEGTQDVQPAKVENDQPETAQTAGVRVCITTTCLRI